MRLNFLSEKVSWFVARKLRVEHDLYIVRNKFYGIGWATTGSRSKYRHWPYSRVVGPWEHR